MLTYLKTKFYFPLAWYFRFFASIRLRRWKPRIVVVTGSNGKTTLLHMLEAQLGEQAKISHHANSSYGIPFDILDLQRKTLRSSEWLTLFLLAPLNAWIKPPKEKIYVVEADTDRWGEGKFLASFLKPEVTLWVSVGSTHGMNFDHLVRNRHPELVSGSNEIPKQVRNDIKNEETFNTVAEAIAYDFGYFLEYCQKFAVINGDLPLEVKQVERTKVKVEIVKKEDDLNEYVLGKDKTTFTINDKKYSFEALLPEELFYSLVMCKETVEYFNLPFDPTFKHFELPPGRGTILRGIKQTALIDSSYNANFASMKAVLGMFEKMPAKKKWVVLSDMLELGESEREEHEKLAEVLRGMELERIVLVGKRVGKYTYEKLGGGPVGRHPHPTSSVTSFPAGARRGSPTPATPIIEAFEKQKDALEYIQRNLNGGEVIFFKGSQSLFLEGIIEALLEDEDDASKLPRRGEFWEGKRKQVGL